MTFKCVKIGHDYRLFSLLNFLCAAIFNFMTVAAIVSKQKSFCVKKLATALRHEIQDRGARGIKKRK